MSEEFLHHTWKFKLFDLRDLRTTDNEELEIIKAGTHNFDAGPDFFNARIRIGNTLWAGNVEVHVDAGDWKRHRHQNDKAYDNIILHVVLHANEQQHRRSGEKIPTLELGDRINKKLYKNYLDFKSNADWIPCAKQIDAAPFFVVSSMIDKLLVERLERKSQQIEQGLALNKNNWEETFYQLLARNFGFNTNAAPFELLAKSLPSNYLGKHKNSLLQIEAMLFGQAGMLEKHLEDKYVLALQNEYAFLKQKFKLQPIEAHLWKFLRLRPVNFPSIRIAQFAALIFRSSRLFSSIIETERSADLKELLNVSVSDYWQTHYIPDKESVRKEKKLGNAAVNAIIINTVVPFLFVYGKQKADERYTERALRFLEETAGESNALVWQWKQLGLPVNTAYNTQALIQLKNEYCDPKKCLSCSIGNYLLKNS